MSTEQHESIQCSFQERPTSGTLVHRLTEEATSGVLSFEGGRGPMDLPETRGLQGPV